MGGGRRSSLHVEEDQFPLMVGDAEEPVRESHPSHGPVRMLVSEPSPRMIHRPMAERMTEPGDKKRRPAARARQGRCNGVPEATSKGSHTKRGGRETIASQSQVHHYSTAVADAIARKGLIGTPQKRCQPYYCA